MKIIIPYEETIENVVNFIQKITDRKKFFIPPQDVITMYPLTPFYFLNFVPNKRSLTRSFVSYDPFLRKKSLQPRTIPSFSLKEEKG